MITCRNRWYIFGLLSIVVLCSILAYNRVQDEWRSPQIIYSPYIPSTFSKGFAGVHNQYLVDVDKWETTSMGKGPGAKIDPRLRGKIDIESQDWERPLEITEDDDPEGIFRNKGISQDDPVLLQYIREKVLIKPSREAYNLTKPNVRDPSEDQATTKFMLPLLESDWVIENSGQRVFFEAGALNGEIASRTLALERFYDWTGLEVEMTAPNIKRFLSKHRKCWFAPVCLSPEPRPTKKQMRFAYDPNDPWLERTGTINKKKFAQEDVKMLSKRLYIYTIVDCFPIYSLLEAAGMTRVDFLNLDLEGVELQVLKTVPWNKVDIQMIVVETAHTEEGLTALKAFMQSVGYEMIDPVKVAPEVGWDLSVKANAAYFRIHQIFVRKSRL